MSFRSRGFTQLFSLLDHGFRYLTQPARPSLLIGVATELPRTRAHLIAENALLRHQLIILQRQVKRPQIGSTDRFWFLLLAARLPHWKKVLIIFQPETLLRWHRQGFRLFWKFKSRNRGGRPKLSAETMALIQQMAKDNRLWRAPRIQGELLKLGVDVFGIHSYDRWRAILRMCCLPPGLLERGCWRFPFQ